MRPKATPEVGEAAHFARFVLTTFRKSRNETFFPIFFRLLTNTCQLRDRFKSSHKEGSQGYCQFSLRKKHLLPSTKYFKLFIKGKSLWGSFTILKIRK